MVSPRELENPKRVYTALEGPGKAAIALTNVLHFGICWRGGVAMIPRERLDYAPIVSRAPLTLPDGVRMVLWPVLALEEWDISRPMARTVIPPPQGQIMLPDVPNWTWHECGMRVGFWRLRRVYERLGILPTVTLNAKVCETYPQVATRV
jgi:allantoinase